MTLTIRLNDDLAAELKKQALSSELPAEELAARLLSDALAQLSQNELENANNQRRLALLQKSSRNTLSKAEQTELEALQASLDQQLESVDAQLLDTLGDMQQAVRELSPN